jgi:hypothetical protein
MSGATGATETDGTVVGLLVKQAMYGVGPSSWTDVTTQTTSLIQDGNLNFTVSPQAFGIIDPAPGVKKTFQGLISINGGKPSLLTKDDSEVFDLSAPTLDKKEKPNHLKAVESVIFYFLVCLAGGYFSYSAYVLGTEGFKSKIAGYILGALVFGGFASFAANDVEYGVFGLIFSTPKLLFLLFFIVFVALCYDINYIDFSYLQKISDIQPSIPDLPDMTDAEETLNAINEK